MAQPVLLDLFCGAGGCAKGYSDAGFRVIGCDHALQPRYPYEFHRLDWREGLERFGGAAGVIHASPPCQGYTSMNNRRRGRRVIKDNPRLVADVLAALDGFGKPYVVENVSGAKAQFAGRHCVCLAGEAFGLRVFRPRLFCSNVLLLTPDLPTRQRDPVAVYGKSPDGRRLWDRKDGTQHRACSSLAEASAAMGIDWMDWDGIRESIPPAYTRFVGKQLLAALEAR